MNKTASIYLDLIRFLSAILVFLAHAKYNRFDGEWLKSVGDLGLGHDAVIIFFVLSGFIIAYITSRKESTLVNYSKRRLARLYSVVVPALVLTLVLDYFGKSINPDMYVGVQYQASDPIYRLFANLFFINELWFNSWRAFSNGPFWSLSYEFWYYVIFASWFFFSHYKRWILTALAMLIAGPKILILLPIWIMGVVAFHLSSRITINNFAALFFAVTPLIVYILIREAGLQKYLLSLTIETLGFDFVYEDLKWSRRFLSDYIVGGLVSIHLIGMISLSKSFSFPSFLEKVIRYFAGMTFAFYLFHYPFLQFFGSFLNEGVAIVVLTSISIILIAPFTEGKKRECAALLEKFAKLLKNISITVLRARRR